MKCVTRIPSLGRLDRDDERVDVAANPQRHGPHFVPQLVEGLQDSRAKRDHDVVRRVRFKPALKVEPWPDLLVVTWRTSFARTPMSTAWVCLPVSSASDSHQPRQQFILDVVAGGGNDHDHRAIAFDVRGFRRPAGLRHDDVMVEASFADQGAQHEGQRAFDPVALRENAASGI